MQGRRRRCRGGVGGAGAASAVQVGMVWVEDNNKGRPYHTTHKRRGSNAVVSRWGLCAHIRAPACARVAEQLAVGWGTHHRHTHACVQRWVGVHLSMWPLWSRAYLSNAVSTATTTAEACARAMPSTTRSVWWCGGWGPGCGVGVWGGGCERQRDNSKREITVGHRCVRGACWWWQVRRVRWHRGGGNVRLTACTRPTCRYVQQAGSVLWERGGVGGTWVGAWVVVVLCPLTVHTKQQPAISKSKARL